jgi:ubiquitin carboxyl-terminal hydrolase 5/13
MPGEFTANNFDTIHTDLSCSHYVAFIRKDPGWILFNDEKVALGGDVDEMKKFAYVYFFRREAA